MKHNYLLRLILLLALLYAPVALGAIYKGRVVERSTHRPLSDIAIVDKGTGRVIGITDSDGRFAIDLADKKEAHTLVFRGIGYDTQEVALASGSSVGHSLRIEMAINVSQIDEVVVTSARRERLLKNEPIVTHVFTARQIERLAAADLQDVLASFIPGVQFSQDNDNAANQTVRIQGLGGSYILFLLDGEPISSKSGESIAKPRGGNIDFSRIDIGNIERIEYLPSGGSILHGSNAIGGVVNIITKRITQPWQAQIGARVAIPHQRRWEARAGLSNERYNMGLSLSQTKTKAYGEGKLRLPAGDALNLALRLGYALTPQLKIKADANSTRSNLYLQTTIPRRRSTHLSESFGIDSYGGRIGAQWQISDKHALDLTTSLDYSQRDIESIEVATSKRERLPDYRNSIWVARLQYNLALAPNHSTMIGLEHTQEHGQTVWLESEAGHTVRNTVAYAQHDAHFWGQKLHLSYGLRYDRHSAFGGRLTHKASVLQKLGPIDLRLIYSEGFRSPTLTELYSYFYHTAGGANFMLVGNPNLKPETSTRYTIQVGYNHRNISLSATGFRTDVRNLIQRPQSIGADGQVYRRLENVDDQVTYYGSEILLRASLANWSLQGSYSYTRNVSRTIHDEGRSYNLSLLRPHSLTATLGYAFSGRCYMADISLSLRYMSKVDYWRRKSTAQVDAEVAAGTHTTKYINVIEDAYSNVRLATALKLYRAYTLQVGIDNLLDYRPTQSNFSSALTPGRNYFLALHVDIDKIFSRQAR